MLNPTHRPGLVPLARKGSHTRTEAFPGMCPNSPRQVIEITFEVREWNQGTKSGVPHFSLLLREVGFSMAKNMPLTLPILPVPCRDLPGAQRAGQRPSFPITIFFFPCAETLQPVILVTACQPARQQNSLRPRAVTLRSLEVMHERASPCQTRKHLQPAEPR